MGNVDATRPCSQGSTDRTGTATTLLGIEDD
jgi:hypothetical protein